MMPHRKSRSAPRLVLAAMAVAAATGAATRAAADLTVTGSVDVGSGGTYDAFTIAISPDLPAQRMPVTVTIDEPTIVGNGLTLAGWSEAGSTGQYAFAFQMQGALIRDSSFAITGSVPADGTVTIRNTQVQSSTTRPAFDFSAMAVTANVTMEVRDTVARLTGAAAGESVVVMGNEIATPFVNYHSALQIVGTTLLEEGACVLRLTSGAQRSVTVNDHSMLSIDGVRAPKLGRAVLCLDAPMLVSASSVLRVSRVDAGSAAGATAAAVDVAGGDLRVTGDSMFALNDITIAGGAVIGTAGAADAGTTAVDGGSVISIVDVDVASFCPACAAQSFPATSTGDSHVYAQDWTVGGAAVAGAGFGDAGLKGGEVLTGMRDGAGTCQPALCLPANSLPMDSAAPVCECNCKPGSSAPMCTATSDAAASYTACADRNCADCSTSAAVCGRCALHFALQDGECVVSACQVDGCDACRRDDPYKCAKCATGYGLGSDGKCGQCTAPYCATCDGNVAKCKACYAGYEFHPSTGVCTNSDDICRATNCVKCAAGNNLQCAQCNTGYGVLSTSKTCGQCRQSNCKSCDGDVNKCTGCGPGYAVTSSGTCAPTQCGSVPYCASCGSTSSTCSTCMSGYSLKNGSCVRCSESNCASCNTSTGKCTTCKSGYTVTAYGTCSPGGRCRVENCAYCSSYSTETCNQCISGYTTGSNSRSCISLSSCTVPRCHTCETNRPTVCRICSSPAVRQSDGTCRTPTHAAARRVTPQALLVAAAAAAVSIAAALI